MTRVWLVDDSELERRIARRALEKQFEVSEFVDGLSLLEAVGAGDVPDVLVLDYHLPGLNGVEVTQRLRELSGAAALPILILSGTHASSENVVEGLRAGANDYLTKPYSPQELAARVEALATAKYQRDRADRAERTLRRLLLNLPDAFLAFDGERRIAFVNQEAERVLGRDWPELLTQPLDSVLPSLAAVVPLAEPQHVANIAIGDRIYAPAFGRLLIDEQHGETTTVTLRDVTESARAIERRDRFLAMLAHELRNPLAPILSATQLIQLRPGDGKAAERAAAIVHRQVERLIRIVDDLLDVSRVSRGRIDLQKRLVDVAGAIESAIESSQPTLASRRHQISWQRPSAPLAVNADPLRFEQMLTNLINNAAKYTDPGGRISVEAAVDDGAAVIRVRDNGIGLSPDMLDSIFEMFVQVDASLHRSQGGLGIGLPLVRQLAAMHEGSVSAASDGLGRGSEFTLRLPLAAAAAAEVDGTARRRVVAGRSRVLVVDDNQDALELLAEAITLAGHDVRTAADGPAAIDAARAHRPDVVFLDIGLPGFDGYEVARRLRGERELDPLFLVALTGYGQAEDVDRARAAGFDLHLVKPVTLESVDQILAGRRS